MLDAFHDRRRLREQQRGRVAAIDAANAAIDKAADITRDIDHLPAMEIVARLNEAAASMIEAASLFSTAGVTEMTLICRLRESELKLLAIRTEKAWLLAQQRGIPRGDAGPGGSEGD